MVRNYNKSVRKAHWAFLPVYTDSKKTARTKTGMRALGAEH